MCQIIDIEKRERKKTKFSCTILVESCLDIRAKIILKKYINHIKLISTLRVFTCGVLHETTRVSSNEEAFRRS